MSEFHALFRVSGPNLDRDEITVTSKGLQVGRSGDNDLTLQHSEISRQHLRIYAHENTYAVEDLKSSNGVWVNDVRIRTQTPHPLKLGDVVRAGPYLFTLDQLIEVGDAVAAPEAAPAVPEPEAPPAEPPVEHLTAPPPEAKPPEKPAKREPAPKEDTTGEVESAAPAKPAKKPPEKPARREPAAKEPARPVDPIEQVERIDVGAFIPRGAGSELARLDTAPPDGTLPPLEANGHVTYPIGVPTDASNWLKYLPAIYSDDDFMGRYLLIFESILSPITWMVDNFDMYLSPEVAPTEWLRWMASWFDVLIVPELPIDRQRALVEQLGWLFFRRGTRAGLERLLTLYYGVKPEIIEDEDMHFTVRLALSDSSVRLEPDIVDRLIMAHKPAHASYTLELT